MRKYSRGIVITGVVVLCALTVAIAGEVADRVVMALPATTGAGAWTNTYDYASLQLTRIWIEDNLLTNNVITVTRVAAQTSAAGTSYSYTQAVGTVTCGCKIYVTGTTNGAGNTATFTADRLLYGDSLVFTPSTATGGTALIEFDVERH